MKFLIDLNLSPEVAVRLIAAGHDAVHARDTGLQSASDEALLDVAAREERVLVSADSRFHPRDRAPRQCPGPQYRQVCAVVVAFGVEQSPVCSRRCDALAEGLDD